MPIQFFTEDIPFQLPEKSKVKNWVKEVIKKHHYSVGHLNYIFSTDEYLLKINQNYLQHDYYTDIITFDHSEKKGSISGDIYISVERIKENAFEQSLNFHDELKRVIIHGVLHLLGFNDQTPAEKGEMRKKEEACLSLYPN